MHSDLNESIKCEKFNNLYKKNKNFQISAASVQFIRVYPTKRDLKNTIQRVF